MSIYRDLVKGFTGKSYLPGKINRLPGKLTVAEAKKLGAEAETIINLAVHDGALYKVIRKQFIGANSLEGIFWASTKAVKTLGKPNVIVKDYESSPGLWVLDDELTGIRWMIWSDAWKKHPWKGTSYEVIVPKGKIEEVAGALCRLIDHLKGEDHEDLDGDSPRRGRR